MLLTSDYDYPLPEHLIARYPPAERSGARMMVLHRAERRIEHRAFTDFSGYLRPGDLAVLNDARVIPASVAANDGALSLLVVARSEPTLWTCLVKPGRKARLGATVRVGGVHGTVEAILADGERVIRFDDVIDLDRHGALPLPPYMERPADASDTTRYQTVFARSPGAVAAPTAGLHFTPEILAGIPHAFLTLHVGVGTFKPVKADDLSEHRMHAERFEITPAAAPTPSTPAPDASWRSARRPSACSKPVRATPPGGSSRSKARPAFSSIRRKPCAGWTRCSRISTCRNPPC